LSTDSRHAPDAALRGPDDRWGGACALGLDRVGTLAPGQAAGLAVWSFEDPRFMGLHDPALATVASRRRPRLSRLLVGGRAVVVDDTIPGLDLGHCARARANSWRRCAAPTRPAERSESC